MTDERSKSIPGAWNRRQLYSAISASLAAGASGAALAQNADEGEAEAAGMLEHVTVTARKREENIQDIPQSIQAFSQQEIDRAGIFEEIHFDFDKSDIREMDRPILARNADNLKKFDFIRVTIEGDT